MWPWDLTNENAKILEVTNTNNPDTLLDVSREFPEHLTNIKWNYQ